MSTLDYRLLPNPYDPIKFEKVLDVSSNDRINAYFVEKIYENETYLFLIPNNYYLEIFWCEWLIEYSINKRTLVCPFLRVATKIKHSTGYWPKLAIQDDGYIFEQGSFLKLDVTQLIENRNLELPEIISKLCQKIQKTKSDVHCGYSDAESYYFNELEGLKGFSKILLENQSELDANPHLALNTNTKARRLKYLTIIAKNVCKPIDIRSLSIKLLQWSKDNNAELTRYVDPKGAIIGLNGVVSAAPYIALAKEMKLITSVSKVIALTNTGKSLVLDQASNISENSFILSDYERLWYVYTILALDRDLILPILCTLQQGKLKKSQLRRNFKDAYIEYLKGLFNHAGRQSSKRVVAEALKRVSSWSKAEKYSEHLVDPRISWLIDLGLVVKEESASISLTRNGISIVELFKPLFKEYSPIVTEYILRRSFFRDIAPRIVPKLQKVTHAENCDKKIFCGKLAEIFEFVRTQTISPIPNRIVASTCFRYAGLYFYLYHNIICDFTFLVQFLQDQRICQEIGWKLRWIKSENDGYLSK